MHNRAGAPEYRPWGLLKFPVPALRDPVSPPVKGITTLRGRTIVVGETFMANWLALNMETDISRIPVIE